MSNGITVVWVPGAWHSPAAFEGPAKIVEKSGYANRFVNLPSVGKALEDSFEDSVEIKRIITEELDQKERDVVLVVHSYGGVCGSNACEGLSKEERQGKKTAVIGTVYLCSFCLTKGATLWNGIGNKPLPWFVEKGDMVAASKSEEIFYNDISPEEQAKWIKELKLHSYNTFKQPSTYEVWKHVPSTYLICEKDNAIPAAAQRRLIEAAGTFKDSHAIDASHSPFLSKPQETADYIIRSIETYFK